MRRHFAQTPHDASAEGYLWVSKDDQRQTTWDRRHGHTTTTKLRVVCKHCNERWMSQMEVAARPFIEPMLLGRPVTLRGSQIETVAAWITLKMMIYDGQDQREAVFTREETLRFKVDRQIPDFVRILVYKAKEPELRAYIARAFANVSNVLDSMAVKSNIQATVFVVGRLVVLFVANRVPTINFNEPSQFQAKRLWAPRNATVVWPPIRLINEDEVAKLALALRRFVQERGILV